MRAEHDRRRPPAGGAASNVTSGDIQSVRLELVVSLERHDRERFADDVERSDRHSVEMLRSTPPGAVVRVVVGDRIYPTNDAVRMLRWVQTFAHVVVMANTLEAGLAWQYAIDGREAS